MTKIMDPIGRLMGLRYKSHPWHGVEIGDSDPIDILILTEKEITHGDILVKAMPIGGFRMIDKNEADDKIIAILNNDAVYGAYKNITDIPEMILARLKHYFLTYKDLPGNKRDCEITHTYDIEEAYEVINLSIKDYQIRFESLNEALSKV